MCGIAGIFDLQGQREIDAKVLTRMNQKQFHRGPDEGGFHYEPGIGIAHRRLSIIDISTGQQPLFNQDRSVCIVFNGEIYNFMEIRAELEGKGYRFNTHSDTETIVYAWEAWGEACVDRLRGMFAFAIWDNKSETLFLARDRFGIKPLFYAILPDNHLIFGSELKVLTTHPDLEKNIDHLAVEEYFALGYIPEPRTIYKQVYKLPPGHTLTIRRDGQLPEPHCYWDIPFQENFESQEISEKELEKELIERFKEAVDIRLVAEVPLGAFLSGGVDSSGVVAMMATLKKEREMQGADQDGQNREPVNTCAISFTEKNFNESEFAQLVADKFKTNHFVNTVESDDFDLIDQLALLYDEPYADSSAMPTYRVCQLAKKRVTVALSGDGGDEVFAGYRRYCWHMNEEKLRSLMPLKMRKLIFGTLGKIYPKADWAPRIFRAKSTFQGLARDSVEGYFHSVSHTSNEQRQSLFSDQMKKSLQGYNAVEVFNQYAERCPTKDPLSLIQYIDMKTYLVGDILTKVDRASMAHSLEVRVPLLDHKFVEWTGTIPSNLKLNGQSGKDIFKKALEPYLPRDILYRPKMGFAVPLAKWFRGPLKERVRAALLGETMINSGLFNMDFIRQLVDQHQSGRSDHSAALWSLLMFESFYRQCVDDTANREAA